MQPQQLWETFEQCKPNDARLVNYFDNLTLSVWLNVNGFAAFGAPLIEYLDVTNLDRIKQLSQSDIQEFVDVLKQDQPSIDLRLRSRFKRQFFDLVTKYSNYIKNKQSTSQSQSTSQDQQLHSPRLNQDEQVIYSKFLQSQNSLSALCTSDEGKDNNNNNNNGLSIAGGYDADGLISPLKELLNDPKYGEICNGLRDKHNQLLNEFQTLQTQCLGEWKLNVHNTQRLQQMQNKINEFEHLQMFKQGYQAELGQLICIEFASALQQRLDHILKQSQHNTVGVYSSFVSDGRGGACGSGEDEKKEQLIQPNVNPHASNPMMTNLNRMYSIYLGCSFTFCYFAFEPSSRWCVLRCKTKNTQKKGQICCNSKLFPFCL